MATPTSHPAFIDSNLDTRLALIVSANDTVSDIKDKIEKEHQLCFPQLGNIKVHGVKVKRKGYYYHLSDSMTVQSAFHGVSNWFLSVDASIASDHSQNHQSYNPVCGNLLTGYDINKVALVDGVDLASGLFPKRSPNLDETQVQVQLDVNEQFVKPKARIAKKEVMESKRMEGKRSIDNIHEARSPNANCREDLGISIMCRPHDREPEVRHSLSTDISASCGRKRENAEYNESLDDRATGKEKRKRKKGMKNLINDHADIHNSICENGVDISQQVVASKTETCGEGSKQILKGIKTVANEPCCRSSSDTLKRSSCRLQSNNICERTEIPDELVISKTYDLLSENPIRVPQYSPVLKKAKKENNNVDGMQYLKANEVLVSEFNEESARDITISEQSGGSINFSIQTALDGLSTEPLENVCLSGTSSSSGKRKKKTKHKTSNLSSQVDVAIFSPSKDNRGQMSILTTGIQVKVSREADVINNIPVHITQDGAVSSFPKISSIEMHYSSASSIHSSFDVDIRNSNIDSGERIRDALEKEAVFVLDRIINAKDNQITDAKGETNQIDGVTEDVISSQTSDKSLPFEKCISTGPNESDVIVNEVITSLGLPECKKIDNVNHDKKKKRKKSKNCGQHTPFEAVIEDSKGNEHENSPIRLHRRVSCNVPLSQTMTEEVASASIACGIDQNCGITESITPSVINGNPLPSGKCISSEKNAADLTVNEENFKKINGSAEPDRKKKKKKSKSLSGKRLLKYVDEHAGGKEFCNSSAGPHETVNFNVCSKKTMVVEMNFSRCPSEEVANAILALSQSVMDDTSVDLVETSQSNGATMKEKKDEKMKKKSIKSGEHDRNVSEALALSSGDRLFKSVDKHARGKEHCNSSAGPHETVNSSVCRKKTMAVEMNFYRSPSEEVANAILLLSRSGMNDTSVDLVEASQSNGATMMEKKDEKMKKKSKKSGARDKNDREALAMSSPNMKIAKGVGNHYQKGLEEKDVLDVQHLTSRKTNVKNNRKVNHLKR